MPDLVKPQFALGTASVVYKPNQLGEIENIVCLGDGQLLTASFMDCGMPSADLFPDFALCTRNVPSSSKAMVIKGSGEAVMIGSCPAVIDALWRGHGIRHLDMPATPSRVWQAIQDAKTA